MNAGIDATLATQLLILSQSVQDVNHEGDIEGLMCKFFISRLESDIAWRVTCANSLWVADNAKSLQQADFGKLASLGYSIYFLSLSERGLYTKTFVDSAKRLQQRKIFPDDQVYFANIPSAFLGIVLGTLAIPDGVEKTELLSWHKGILTEVQHRNRPNGFGKLLYDYLGTLLDQNTILVPIPDARCSIGELAFVDWGRRHNAFHISDPEKNIRILQERILTLTCSVNVSELPASEAAIVWETVDSCLSSSIHDRVLSPSHVVQLLSRFESSMRRWRWDPDEKIWTVRWPINDERSVQDIIWLILRSVFDDLVDEEMLPKLGHSSYKPDFGIPSIGTLVEVKFARKREDFRRIEKEVMEDLVAYLQVTKVYRRLVVFIYDDSASVQEHEVTKAALQKLPNMEGVIVVSRPSQIPPT